MMRSTQLLPACLLFFSALSAHAEETVATLRLDGLSFVSYGSQHVYAVPPGSWMRLRFGDVRSGSIPLRVEPQDVEIGELKLRDDDESFLQFGLVRRAVGHAYRNADGTVKIELDALVSVIVNDRERGGSDVVRVRFTTETAASTGTDGLGTRSITGMRPAAGSKAIQLVSATVTEPGGYPVPGAAVLVVLSGVLDRIPTVP
jgi:hypothetical protein